MKKPFVIIELAGGLGNQMFQYAFFLKMQSLEYPCKFYYDNSQYTHNGPELERAFGVKPVYSDDAELTEVLDKKKDFLSGVRRKLRGARPSRYWEHDKGYAYKPEIFNQPKPIYLQGCWLSGRYFEDIEDKVRTAFQFSAIHGQENILLLNRIHSSENSVSIHIRRGDYLTSGIHLNLNYPDYLQKALAQLPGDPKVYEYFIFTDDEQTASEIVRSLDCGSHNVHFSTGNRGSKSWIDMALMSQCRHQIICNSTFSWWAAWLNPNTDKIVISPEHWFTTDFLNDNDIVPDTWIKI